MKRPGANLCVFRDARERIAKGDLLDRLDASLARTSTLDALLAAGEMESIIADHDTPMRIEAESVTDRLADAYLGQAVSMPVLSRELIRGLTPTVELSPPESFAYYALDPQSFAILARDLDVPTGEAFVLGIRTIGTTLSAIVRATLGARGIVAARATVRPTGHPYDRTLALAPSLEATIQGPRDRKASFFLVDEGPGMSGSSFLATAEALCRSGVDPSTITFLGTRTVDFDSLLARDAEPRFRRFRALLAAPRAPVPEGAHDLSAGAWRSWLWRDEACFPASWPAIERVKHLTDGGTSILKFEGLGRFGEAASQRAAMIAEAGFGPNTAPSAGGFVRYERLWQRPLSRADRSAHVVERLADYCAFRASAFAVREADTTHLTAMVRENAEVLLGRAIELDLPVETPIIADARLHPHEWIEGPKGLCKTDGTAHGDDHLYPGPTDVAWDLAGAIVEWDLDESASSTLLDRVARATGAHAARRLPAYLIAYVISQWARAEMACGVHLGTLEGARWRAECARYQSALDRIEGGSR